ncbi:DNA repair protein rad51d [Pleodorina starrii]|uniref:DNA repair protein rad51d n=1 Tax=Pleodorina starrii TaxID=330485 RepID=A0A9W6BFH5_9CHLO|nr:DNA repair protein rad51d [Pleodorina starrii]GLC51093.1 DNA repair protein rad51d [Pleodorina starrii]GLC63451.1 DNA repair protein rad51d [Pleodorina starrii]
MRWEELNSLVSHSALLSLARSYSSVESFLVNRSKALAAAPAHGGLQGGGAGAGAGGVDACPGVDAGTLAAVEAVLEGCLAPQWRSGAQLMHELRHTIQVLPTGCAAIDSLLGGGLREGTLVEVAGETASGKTQLCLSAAATTAYRNEAVLYVDTTGSFAPERIVQMAEAEAAAASSGAWQQAPDAGLAARVLGCISVLRPSNVYELLVPLDRLGAALQQQQPGSDQPAFGAAGGVEARGARVGPRLLIVDSVSALLSTVLASTQHTQGTALLTAVGRALKQLAEQHSIAVLVTNHVTGAGPMTRGGRAGGGGGSGGDGGASERGISAAAAVGVGGLKPALGEQWRPQPHMRVQLSMSESQSPQSGVRLATLTASPLQACGQKLEFRICASGLV